MRARVGIAVASALLPALVFARGQDERLARLPAEARGWLQDEGGFTLFHGIHGLEAPVLLLRPRQSGYRSRLGRAS